MKTDSNLLWKKGNSKIFFSEILGRFKKGDCQGIIADLNWALKVDASDSEAYCCRGIIRDKQGDNLGAISDLIKLCS